MLLNEQEVLGFCLKQSVVDDYTAQVTNLILEGFKENPVRGYGVARSLLDIMTTVTREAGAAMEAFCEKNNIGSDGKDFEHEGCIYRRKFDIDYNYAANATDEEGNPIPYTGAVRDVERAKISLNAKKTIVNAFKDLILNAHPNMKPELISVTCQLRGYMPE